MKSGKMFCYMYFVGIIAIIFFIEFCEKSPMAHKFFIGMFVIQIVLIAKDNAKIIIQSLFFKRPSLFDVYQVKQIIKDKIFTTILVVLVLIIGSLFWLVSWEGQTGVVFGLGAFIGSLFYDYSFHMFIIEHIKEIKNA